MGPRNVINTKAVCISFIVECEGGDTDGTMFIVFHRGNAKKIFGQFEWDFFDVNIKDVVFSCTHPIFSVRNAILKKLVKDSHDKYQVCMVHDKFIPQIQRFVNRAAIKELTKNHYKIKSRLVWKATE